jgi:hypothetical protein
VTACGTQTGLPGEHPHVPMRPSQSDIFLSLPNPSDRASYREV